MIESLVVWYCSPL